MILHLRCMKSPVSLSSSTASLLFASLCLVLGGMLPAGLAAESEGELKKRLRESEREVERLRDSLHEAQRELGAKAERIEDLERALADGVKKTGKGSANPRKREAEKRGEAPSAPGKKRRVPEPPKPSPALQKQVAVPAVFTLKYEANSAVNYEGREKALVWAKEQLADQPATTFEVSARADDSRYAEVNRTIAANRAKYLVDYLALSGLPRDRFSLIEAKENGGGRDATITANTATGEKEEKGGRREPR